MQHLSHVAQIRRARAAAVAFRTCRLSTRFAGGAGGIWWPFEENSLLMTRLLLLERLQHAMSCRFAPISASAPTPVF